MKFYWLHDWFAMNVQVSEAYFWSQCKSWLGAVSGTHACRIENTAGTGISDVNVCYDGCEVWLELKVVHGNFVQFRTSQRIWMRHRLSVGGRVFVAVRNLNGVSIYNAESILNTAYRVLKGGKAFTIRVDDLPNPVWSGRLPISATSFHAALFKKH